MLTRLAEGFTARMADYAAALTLGVEIDAWYAGMKWEIIRSNATAAIAGKGGFLRMTLQDWGRVVEQVRGEFGYLAQFAQDVADGKLSPAQIAARASLYSQHAQVSYWQANVSAKRQAGFTQERRVLGQAEHCPDCVGYAAEGWVPIGSLPAPGDGSVCRANCQCTKEYR